MRENVGRGEGMVIERSSYFKFAMVAAIVLAFAILAAAPLFAADSVPPAKLQVVNVPGTCMLAGYHHDFSPAELKARYHDRTGYMREVEKATQEVLKAGFILPYDAEKIRQSANASDVFVDGGGDVKTNRKTDSGIEIRELMRADASWNGAPYGAYPEGAAEPVVAKTTIPAHGVLTWHSHPMPSLAYILSGEITVEDDKGNRKHFAAGDVMPETVGTLHHGFVGDQAATFIVFYAGTKGMPLAEHSAK